MGILAPMYRKYPPPTDWVIAVVFAIVVVAAVGYLALSLR